MICDRGTTECASDYSKNGGFPHRSLFRIKNCFDQWKISLIYKAVVIHWCKDKLCQEAADEKDNDQYHTEFVKTAYLRLLFFEYVKMI